VELRDLAAGSRIAAELSDALGFIRTALLVFAGVGVAMADVFLRVMRRLEPHRAAPAWANGWTVIRYWCLAPLQTVAVLASPRLHRDGRRIAA
jgi:heme/copper-type cytochrome/quinol oxidase subunit 2